jgi:prepilin-type N-terminal cleavage/methylation domain-containing protein
MQDARPGGFSLIEVLVAMALTMMLVIGAAELTAWAIRAKRTGDIAAALTQAIVDRLESLKSLPFDDAGLAAGAYEGTVRVELGHALVSEEWEITDDGEGSKMIRLKARRAGKSGPGASAVLFISRELGFGP